MVEAAVKKAAEIGVLETVCVVDDGGYPIALDRMDGARITGPQIAWNKAFTASGHKRSTHLFNKAPGGPALPGNEAFGIQLSFEGRFAVFVGGFPARRVLLAVAAGKLQPEGLEVLVQADIKK